MASKPITGLSAVVSLYVRSRAFLIIFESSSVFPQTSGLCFRFTTTSCPEKRLLRDEPWVGCRYMYTTTPRHHPIVSLSLRLNRCGIHYTARARLRQCPLAPRTVAPMTHILLLLLYEDESPLLHCRVILFRPHLYSLVLS